MILTRVECELLYDMINASLLMSKNSGIPVNKDYYEIIDTLKEKLRQEQIDAYKEGR